MLAVTPIDTFEAGPGDLIQRTRAFDTAMRHSRRVRALKWLLPTVALVLAAGFLAQSWRAAPVSAALESEENTISDGKLVMASPKLDGFTKDNLPYSMIATRAVQDVADQGVVLLEGIGAKLPISSDDLADVAARSGVFDRARNTLDLDSEIVVQTTDGVMAKLQSASINVGERAMRTDKPVEIRFKGATIKSDAMSIAQGGNVVTFENRVRVKIEPTHGQGVAQSEGGSDAIE